MSFPARAEGLVNSIKGSRFEGYQEAVTTELTSIPEESFHRCIGKRQRRMRRYIRQGEEYFEEVTYVVCDLELKRLLVKPVPLLIKHAILFNSYPSRPHPSSSSFSFFFFSPKLSQNNQQPLSPPLNLWSIPTFFCLLSLYLTPFPIHIYALLSISSFC